jgi:hypothetical protein
MRWSCTSASAAAAWTSGSHRRDPLDQLAAQRLHRRHGGVNLAQHGPDAVEQRLAGDGQLHLVG